MNTQKRSGFSEPKLPYIVCAKTREYRTVVPKVCHSDDVVLEVGSAHGVTCSMISKFCKKVVGIDKGQKEVEISRERYPHIEFHIMDGNKVHEISKLGDFNIIFVDISGVVELKTLLDILRQLEMHLKPRLLVVKSLELMKLYCKLKNGEKKFSSDSNIDGERPHSEGDSSYPVRNVMSAQLMLLKGKVLQRAANQKIDMKVIKIFPTPFQTGKIPKCFKERAKICNIPIQRILKCVFVSFGREILLYVLPHFTPIDLALIANSLACNKFDADYYKSRLFIARSKDLKTAGLLKDFRNAFLTYGVLPPFGISLPTPIKDGSNTKADTPTSTKVKFNVPLYLDSDNSSFRVKSSNGTAENTRTEVTPENMDNADTKRGSNSALNSTSTHRHLRTFLHPELFFISWHQELIFELDFGEYIELSASSLQQATSGIMLQYPDGSSSSLTSSSNSRGNSHIDLFAKTWPPPAITMPERRSRHHSIMSMSPLAYGSAMESDVEVECLNEKLNQLDPIISGQTSPNSQEVLDEKLNCGFDLASNGSLPMGSNSQEDFICAERFPSFPTSEADDRHLLNCQPFPASEVHLGVVKTQQACRRYVESDYSKCEHLHGSCKKNPSAGHSLADTYEEITEFLDKNDSEIESTLHDDHHSKSNGCATNGVQKNNRSELKVVRKGEHEERKRMKARVSKNDPSGLFSVFCGRAGFLFLGFGGCICLYTALNSKSKQKAISSMNG